MWVTSAHCDGLSAQYGGLLSLHASVCAEDPSDEITLPVVSGHCSVCQFFEKSLTSKEKWETVSFELSGSSGCRCLAQVNDSCDKRGVKPLHVACSRSSLPVIQFLLERGAVVNAVTIVQSRTPLQVSH